MAICIYRLSIAAKIEVFFSLLFAHYRLGHPLHHSFHLAGQSLPKRRLAR